MMSNAMMRMSAEEVYFESQDDRQAQTPQDAIMKILADKVLHNATIYDYVCTTLATHDTRPYASITDAVAMGQELARIIADAYAGQEAMMLAVEGR